MSKRRRYKQSISLKGRLANFAEEDSGRHPIFRPAATAMRCSKKSQADIASRVDEWATRADRSRRLGAMTINENARQPNDG